MSIKILTGRDETDEYGQITYPQITSQLSQQVLVSLDCLEHLKSGNSLLRWLTDWVRQDPYQAIGVTLAQLYSKSQDSLQTILYQKLVSKGWFPIA